MTAERGNSRERIRDGQGGERQGPWPSGGLAFVGAGTPCAVVEGGRGVRPLGGAWHALF